MSTRVLTLDTSVIGHAQNPENSYFDCASEVFDHLMDSESTVLVIDDGGLLWAEYETQLGTPSYPRDVLTACLDSGRLQEASIAEVSTELRTLVRRLISQNKPRDRTLLLVALTHRGLLLTDDNMDFTATVRREIRRLTSLLVLDACQGAAKLSE
jgi:hypothetical protein